MLLPVSFVPVAFTQLKMMKQQLVPEDLTEPFDLFLDYFQTTWMPYNNRKTSKQGYTLKDWNIFKADIRTNDLAEIQNFIIHRQIGSHPDIFDFIVHLQELAVDCDIRMRQLVKHHTSNLRSVDEEKKNKKLDLLFQLIEQKPPKIDVYIYLFWRMLPQ